MDLLDGWALLEQLGQTAGALIANVVFVELQDPEFLTSAAEAQDDAETLSSERIVAKVNLFKIVVLLPQRQLRQRLVREPPVGVVQAPALPLMSISSTTTHLGGGPPPHPGS